jgi:hypothetical protein
MLKVYEQNLFLVFFTCRAVFKFDENNRLGVTATGNNFADFKSNFGNDDRGFGYIRIMVTSNKLHQYFFSELCSGSFNIDFPARGLGALHFSDTFLTK